VAAEAAPFAPRDVPDHVLVKFKADASATSVAAALERAGTRQLHSVRALGVRVVQIAPSRRDQAIASLRASRAVQYAERDGLVPAAEVVPNDMWWPS
jgi:predicted Fe-Mo cluster-binding NifX family protein